jgi:hypothetical protein
MSNNPWVEHVRKVAKDEGISYMCAVSKASETYEKKGRTKKLIEYLTQKEQEDYKIYEKKLKTIDSEENPDEWERYYTAFQALQVKMNKLQDRNEKGKQSRNDMDVMREQTYKESGFKSAKALKDAKNIDNKKSTEELKKLRLDYIKSQTEKFPEKNQDMINNIEAILTRRDKAEERKKKEKEKEKKMKASFKQAVQKKDEEYKKKMDM